MTQQSLSFVILSIVLSLPTLARGDMAEKILFVSARDQERGLAIYSMNPDGSDQKRISPKGEMAFDPVFSPDRKQIAFAAISGEDLETRKSEIYIINADGSGKRQFTDLGIFAFGPSWSPDGKQIAFSFMEPKRGPPENVEMCIKAVDGSYSASLGEGLLPRWSPDGKKIAYTVIGDGPGDKPSQMIMDADGENAKQLFPGAAMMGIWSPDGKKLAYIGEVEDDWIDVMVADADGSDAKQVTKTKDVFEMGVGWLQDSQRLYFVNGPVQSGPRSMEIFSIGIDGKALKQLTDNKAMDALVGAAMMSGSSESRSSDSRSVPERREEKKPSSTIEEKEIDVELPSASEARPLTQKRATIFINIDQDGKTSVDHKTLDDDELVARLKQAVADHSRNASVVIRADRQCPITHVVEVINHCQRLGLTDYSLAVLSEDQEGTK